MHIFRELIASMEKYQGSENSSNLSVQYPEVNKQK